MTCEIAVANRLGIALAADSAVTFSNEDGQQTYASGANKIVQLAARRPIAAMIYNNAGLETMPWDVLLKEYRSKLCNGGFGTGLEYKDDLVAFLNGNTALLPQSMRERGALPTFYIAISTILERAKELAPTLQDRAAAPNLLGSEWQRVISVISDEIKGQNVCDCLDASDLPAQTELASKEIVPPLNDFLRSTYPHLAPSPIYTMPQKFAESLRKWGTCNLRCPPAAT